MYSNGKRDKADNAAPNSYDYSFVSPPQKIRLPGLAKRFSKESSFINRESDNLESKTVNK